MSGKILKKSSSGNCQEFHVVSVKNEILVNVREFYKFQFESNGETLKIANPVFLTFMTQAKSF